MKAHAQGLVKLGLLLCILLLMGAAYWGAPDFFQNIWQLLRRGELVEIAAYIASYGEWAVVFAFLLTVIFNAIGFPPAMIFSASCTLIFGIVPGILLAWVAETVGAVISFLFFRTFLRDSAEQLIAKNSKLKEWDEKSESSGFRVMLIARLIPYFPAAALNALGALSRMSLWDYTASSFIGKFPATAIEALIGHDAVTMGDHMDRLLIVVGISVALYVAFWWWERKRQ